MMLSSFFPPYLLQPVSAQIASEDEEPEPDFTAVQDGRRTVILLATNWTVAATDNQITMTSSNPIQKVHNSDWWNVTEQSSNKVTFNMIENVYRTSRFFIYSNSSDVSYDYTMVVNSTSYSGKIIPTQSDQEYHFKKWSSGRENTATAFIPENWEADLQIIRPYDSMTGFVFFARDSTNPHTLVYVFQPFVPMHILPSEMLCQDEPVFCTPLGQTTISVDQVNNIRFGNAPLSVSEFKEPDDYFGGEIMPILSRNLNSYRVALSTMDSVVVEKDSELDLLPALKVEYNFRSENNDVNGIAAVFTKNYTNTDNDIGFWNGFVVGVESTEDDFEQTFENALVTLYTLRFDNEWLDNEKQVLMGRAMAEKNSTSVTHLSRLVANNTIDDFNLFPETAAGLFAKSSNETKVLGFTGLGEEYELPLYGDLRHWYLTEDGNALLGKYADSLPQGYRKLQSLYL